MKRYVCEVHYVVEGLDESKRRDRKLIEKMKEWYQTMRDDIIEVTNPLLEMWNADFDKTYGKKDLVNNEEDQRAYNKFMADKMNGITKLFDGSVNKHFIMRSDPDLEADFVGIYEHRKTKARIHMYITNLRAV